MLRPAIYFEEGLHPKYTVYLDATAEGTIVPCYGLRSFALEKMVEEVLNNAADQKSRADVKKISIEFDEGTGRVVVQNDGAGIPIEATKTHDGREVYVPELVMGHLRSGNNFDDDADRRTTGGCNGVGVKLTNIYSAEFEVRTGVEEGPEKKRRLYVQKWRDRMGACGKPTIKKGRAMDVGTRVAFVPRYDLFEVPQTLPSLGAYFRRRAAELCATLNAHVPSAKDRVRVFYQGEEVKWTLDRYAKAFSGAAPTPSTPGSAGR